MVRTLITTYIYIERKLACRLQHDCYSYFTVCNRIPPKTHLKRSRLRGQFLAPERNKLLDAEKAHGQMSDVHDAVSLSDLKSENRCASKLVSQKC